MCMQSKFTIFFIIFSFLLLQKEEVTESLYVSGIDFGLGDRMVLSFKSSARRIPLEEVNDVSDLLLPITDAVLFYLVLSSCCLG